MPIFDYRMCRQCVLFSTGHVLPHELPKGAPQRSLCVGHADSGLWLGLRQKASKLTILSISLQAQLSLQDRPPSLVLPISLNSIFKPVLPPKNPSELGDFRSGFADRRDFHYGL